MYIAEKAGKLFPQEWNKKYDVLQWVYWQMGGLGPMQVRTLTPVAICWPQLDARRIWKPSIGCIMSVPSISPL